MLGWISAFDMHSAHAKGHSFRDANGILRTLSKEQACHYHLNVACIIEQW